jgi:hypothetical protein
VVLNTIQLSELENFGVRGGEWDNSCFMKYPRVTLRILVGEDALFNEFGKSQLMLEFANSRLFSGQMTHFDQLILRRNS